MNILKKAGMYLAVAVITFASALVAQAQCSDIVVSINGPNVARCNLTSQTATTCTYYCTCSGSCTEALKPFLQG
jgi:hypothetical protein